MNTDYQRTERLTMPIFSLAHQQHIFIHVVGEIHETLMPGLSSDPDKPVKMIRVVNLDTGEEGNLLVLSVLESALIREPNGYVGKDYEVITGEQQPGKDYRPVDIYRLEASVSAKGKKGDK